ncbi:MAG: GYD domain-containing protein [Candidatus Binataceae bacterium]|nr:GYD domain-containing protein [Candidatus Binataceae bacterium]
MPYYIMGVNRTEKGVHTVTDLAQKIAAITKERRQLNGRMISAWATFGRYEIMFVVEFPSDHEALEIVQSNTIDGLITVEVSEAIPLQEFAEILAQPD